MHIGEMAGGEESIEEDYRTTQQPSGALSLLVSSTLSMNIATVKYTAVEKHSSIERLLSSRGKCRR